MKVRTIICCPSFTISCFKFFSAFTVFFKEFSQFPLPLITGCSQRGPARGGGVPGGDANEPTQDVDVGSRAPPPTLLSSFGEGEQPACCPGGRPHNN